MHAAADGGGAERRPGLRILRAVALRSDRHGLHGVADVVELRGGAPMPVEYKRGRPKAHRADEVQLCAQAMCLEDMFGCAIPEGELFYGAQRRRVPVTLDPALRGMVLDAAGAIRAATAAGRAPPPVHAERKCAQCSLVEACRPRRLGNPGSVARWLRAQLAAEGAPE